MTISKLCHCSNQIRPVAVDRTSFEMSRKPLKTSLVCHGPAIAALNLGAVLSPAHLGQVVLEYLPREEAAILLPNANQTCRLRIAQADERDVAEPSDRCATSWRIKRPDHRLVDAGAGCPVRRHRIRNECFPPLNDIFPKRWAERPVARRKDLPLWRLLLWRLRRQQHHGRDQAEHPLRRSGAGTFV